MNYIDESINYEDRENTKHSIFNSQRLNNNDTKCYDQGCVLMKKEIFF